VLFYSCDGSLAGAPDFSLTAIDDFYKETSNMKNRYLVWTDEYGTIHTSGSNADPIHNLGYLESTAAAPARKSPGMIMQAIIRPDLRIVDGDIFELSSLGGLSSGFALVSEEYAAADKAHKPPRWATILDCNQIFDNTPGGSIPSAIERAVNYIPVNTSAFNSILTANTNNLQAALDKIDDSFAFGRWTPTLTNVALINVGASVVYACQYTRIGDEVMVAGVIALTTTGAGTAQANLTPPIATNFVNTEDADGNCTSPAATYGSVIPDTTNDRLQLVFASAAATTYWLRFMAMYRLQ
jgi:hypothetical protein